MFKLRVFILVVGILFFSMASVSAWKIDNHKTDLEFGDGISEYGRLKIENLFGWGKDLADLELIENTDNCMESCSAEKEIILYEDSPLIDDVRFMTILKNGGMVEQRIRSYRFYVKSGKGDYELYQLGTKMKAGIYMVRLEGKKRPTREVDWQIKSQGVWIDDWAVWGTLPDLLYYWKLDETSGTESFESVNGNGEKNITWNSAPIWDPGIIGNSANLGAVGSGTTQIDLGTNAFSVSMWVNSSLGGNHATFFGNLNGSDGVSLGMAGTGLKQPELFVLDGGVQTISGALTTNNSINLSTSEWQHISLTFDGASTWKFYRNGVNEPLTDETGTLGSSTKNFTAGFTQGFLSYNGALDEIGIWNRTLNSSEIAEVYNAGVGKTYPFGGIVLNSPLDNYLSPIADVLFNCSATPGSGATLTNITVWHNATGTFARNLTNAVTGATNTTTFNITFVEGNYKWGCSATDTDNDEGFSSNNRSFGVDFTGPNITINNPLTTIDYGIVDTNLTLNWSVVEPNLDSMWYNYNGTNVTVFGLENTTQFVIVSYANRNLTFYANDSNGNLNSTFASWNYKVFEGTSTFNATTYETLSESFETQFNSTISISSAVLKYNGIGTDGTVSGNTTTATYVLPISTDTSGQFHWNLTLTDGTNLITNNQSQTISQINLGLCNQTFNNTYVNFTFKDENTLASIGAFVDTSTWSYWLGGGTVTKPLIFANATVSNPSYAFCFSPQDKTAIIDLSFKYSNTTYPQRTWTYDDQSLTNSTTNKVLYLLNSGDGIYSTFQVTESLGTPISGAAVTIERQISNVWILLEQGFTGSDGAITFWVNPNFDHRVTASKTSYTTNQVTIRPSQSIYTIILSRTTGNATYSSDIPGIKWVAYPSPGSIKIGSHNFNVTVTAADSNLENCRFELLNATNSSQIIATSTSFTNSTYCRPSFDYTVIENQNFFGRLSLDTTSTTGWIFVDTDWKWVAIDLNINNWRTITSFFSDIKDLSEFGEGNEREFSRYMFFFILSTIFLCVFFYFTGFEVNNPGISILIIWFIVLVASISGFLSFNSGSNNIDTIWEQYAFLLIFSLLSLGYVLNKIRRDSE